MAIHQCFGHIGVPGCILSNAGIFNASAVPPGLVYVCCAIVPVLLNFGICFASYRWHLQFRAALARELEQIRARR